MLWVSASTAFFEFSQTLACVSRNTGKVFSITLRKHCEKKRKTTIMGIKMLMVLLSLAAVVHAMLCVECQLSCHAMLCLMQNLPNYCAVGVEIKSGNTYCNLSTS